MTRRQLLLGAGAALVVGPLYRMVGSPVAVDWMWSGGLTDDAFTVVAKLTTSATSCRLAVDDDSGLGTPVYSAAATPDANNYVRMSISGLTANTQYHYAVEIDSTLDALRGKAKTCPTEGAAASFKFAFGSCAATGSTGVVWDEIRRRAPLFFAHLGDLHYENIATNSEAAFRTAYETVLASAEQADLYRDVPIAYSWDDHDYGGDNTGAAFVGREAAATVYRQAVPHHALPAGTGNSPIYQTWRVGRVKFILTDVRHQRDPNGDTDDASKTMLGATQKAWFKAQLDDARDSGDMLVVWLNSNVWPVDTLTGVDADGDHWGAFTTERAELANYMAGHGSPQVLICSGDAHMMAWQIIDYSTAQTAPVWVCQAAALDQTAIERGAGWVEKVAGGSQFGMVSIEDDGSTFRVVFDGVNATGEGARIHAEFGSRPRRVMVYNGTSWVERPVKVYDGASFVRRTTYA